VLALALFGWNRDFVPPPAPTASIGIRARPIGPDATGLQPGGAARFLGALELESDAPGFQGFSALWVEAKGESLVAIADIARVLRGRLVWRDGRLEDLVEATLGPVRDTDGRFVAGRSRRDAEGIAREPGGFLVSFERDHRIWRYAPDMDASATPVEPPLPKEIDGTAANGGVEALTRTADGRALALVERLDGSTPRSRRAFLLERGAWSALDYARDDEMDPVGADTLPNGDLLVIERSSPLDWARGIRVRLRRIPGASIAAGARLTGPVIASFGRSPAAENYEGVASFTGPAGGTVLLLISDGGGLPRQRTILVGLAVAP
jgi:hypothetical protein